MSNQTVAPCHVGPKSINYHHNDDTTRDKFNNHQHPQQQAKGSSLVSPPNITEDSAKASTRNTQMAASKPNNTEMLYRVGYWWSEKKSQKLNGIELAALFAERQCDFVKITFDKPIDEQGPFNLIVHKISDIIVKADLGDMDARRILKEFESYSRKHPETVVLDPVDKNSLLLDRYKQYRLIEETRLAKNNVIFTPPFVHLTSTNIHVNKGRIRRSKLTFPIVCKPILAQGSSVAHQMSIIYNENGLKDIKPPCVAQSFLNHNAKLFKLFVIKDKYYVIERPSLKNFHNCENNETVFFFSHDISKPNSSSSLTELDDYDKLRLQGLCHRMNELMNDGDMNRLTTQTNEHQVPPNNRSSSAQRHSNSTIITKLTRKPFNIPIKKQQSTIFQNNTIKFQAPTPSTPNSSHKKPSNEELAPSKEQPKDHERKQNDSSNLASYDSLLKPDHNKLREIVEELTEKLGLTFYGLDIIIEDGTSRYAIIDMNTFPGYDGVDNFLAIFRDVVCDAIPQDQMDSDGNRLHNTCNLIKRKPKEFDSGIEST